MILDANIVIATHRQDHPNHNLVRSWFDELANNGLRFAVPEIVWVAFFRVVTNSRIFGVPTPVAQAIEFARALRAQPGYQRYESDPRTLVIFEDLCQATNVSANLVPDAFLAALATTHACPIATLDRDFRRFDGIRLIEPTSI